MEKQKLKISGIVAVFVFSVFILASLLTAIGDSNRTKAHNLIQYDTILLD